MFRWPYKGFLLRRPNLEDLVSIGVRSRKQLLWPPTLGGTPSGNVRNVLNCTLLT